MPLVLIQYGVAIFVAFLVIMLWNMSLRREMRRRKQIEMALYEREEAFRHLFEDSNDPVLLIKEERFVDCNTAALTQLGYGSKAEFVNCRPCDISPKLQPDGRDSEEKATEMIATALRLGYHKFEWLHVRINGSVFSVEVTATAMTIKGESIIHVCWRDITERKQVEAALKRSRDELVHFFEQPLIGMVTSYPNTQTLHVNQRFCDIVGYSEEEMQTITWAEITHPDDLIIDLAYLDQVLRGKINSYQMEKRYIHKDGHWVYVHLAVDSVRDVQGQVDYFIGMVLDITERKQIEAALKRSRDELVHFFEQPLIGMVTSYPNTQTLHVNQRFCDIVGYSEEEMQTITWAEITHPDDLIIDLAYLDQVLRGKINSYQMEKRYIHKDGHWVYVHLAVDSVRDVQGQVDYFIGMVLDITERKITEERINQLAFYDPLTQLPNRRLLYERLKHSIEVSHRTGHFIAVLMLDLDKFKAVNDTFGHAAGDELLQQVAERIKVHLREMDTVARLGGDEFVVLIENVTQPEQVAHVANNIIHTLKQPFSLSKNHEAHIGTSIGIALYPQHGNDIETLIDNSDAALYHAKDNGRGCFAYFSGSPVGRNKPY
ncbi:MAG: PAS domain S-box protein [Methylococcales bacterium]